MSEPGRSPFLAQLEAAVTDASQRERFSSRFLTLCLLVTVASSGAWIFTRGDIHVADVYFMAGPWPGTIFEAPIAWAAEQLPWVMALCYGVLGAAALLHFAVFRREAQRLRRQRSQALLIELEDALKRRAEQRPPK